MHQRLEEIGAAVGVVTAAGVVLTIFTAGISDATALMIDGEIAGDAAIALTEFSVAVSETVSVALDAEFGPMLEAAASGLPEIDTVEAELEQTATDLERVDIREPVGARSGGGGGGGGGVVAVAAAVAARVVAVAAAVVVEAVMAAIRRVMSRGPMRSPCLTMRSSAC